MSKVTVIRITRLATVESKIRQAIRSKRKLVEDTLRYFGMEVCLGVLGARWTWCGKSKTITVLPPTLYVNHNRDHAVTCKRCLRRIKMGSPVPLVRKAIARECRRVQ